jgi:hypothetical protein
MMMAAALLATACDEAVSRSGCDDDRGCTTGFACMARACVARGSPSPFLVELIPDPNLTGARTDVLGFVFTNAPAVFTLGSRTMITARALVTGSLSSQMSVGRLQATLSIPAPAGPPDRAAMELTTSATGTSMAGQTEFTFKFDVGTDVLGRRAALAFVPKDAAEGLLPPFRTEVELNPSLMVTLPGTADLGRLDGVLLSELGDPLGGFVARAIRAGRLVSNRALTDNDGRFQIRFARPGPAEAALPMTIEIAASDGTLSRPRLTVTVSPGEAPTELGTLTMPPSPAAAVLNIPVLGTERDGVRVKIAGATLRMTTTIETAKPVTATFVSEVLTGGDGMAQVALVPGTVDANRVYRLAVLPPPGSPFAARCFAAYEVGPASDVPRTGAAIELDRKPVLRGRVLSPDGDPLSRVAVTAAPIGPPPKKSCGALPAASGVTLTTSEGSFELALDPGAYAITYEAPEGSPHPWLSETVTLDSSVLREIRLAPGRAIEGQVLTSATPTPGVPAPSCEVRLYQGDQLAARALTDAVGRFRVAVPAGDPFAP